LRLLEAPIPPLRRLVGRRDPCGVDHDLVAATALWLGDPERGPGGADLRLDGHDVLRGRRGVECRAGGFEAVRGLVGVPCERARISSRASRRTVRNVSSSRRD
jgi:hypothetical protein